MELLAIAMVLLLGAGALVGTAIVAWHRVQSPIVEAFAVIAASMGIGGLFLSIGFATERWFLVLGTTISLGMILPILWFWFSVEYVGISEFSTRTNVAIISFPVVLGVSATAILLGSHVAPWVDVPLDSAATGRFAVAFTALSLLQWFTLLYAGGLLLAGCGVILWAFQRYRHLDSATGIVLGTFGTVPWLSLLFGLQLQTISIVAFGATVSVGFLVGGAAAIGLFGPFPLFERVPSAANIGPRTIIEELNDLVVVTDRDGTIVELNASARRAFEHSDVVVGMSIEAFLDSSITELQDVAIIDLETVHGRILFATTVSPLTDQHDQLLGYGIVLRDMTAQTIRRQLLEVINRVLRHNLRNDMLVILGHAELIRNDAGDPALSASAGTIHASGTKLSELAEKFREAERVLDIDMTSTHRTAVRPLVEDVFAHIAGDRDVTYSYHGPSTGTVAVPEDLLRLILYNLVTNAVEHNDSARPTVDVTVSETAAETYPLRISISDDGPGIPEQESRAIEVGSETPLEHGSGIGLWIVRIATTKLGGKLTFAERAPRGTVVTIHLPTPLRSTATETERAAGEPTM